MTGVNPVKDFLLKMEWEKDISDFWDMQFPLHNFGK